MNVQCVFQCLLCVFTNLFFSDSVDCVLYLLVSSKQELSDLSTPVRGVVTVRSIDYSCAVLIDGEVIGFCGSCGN